MNLQKKSRALLSFLLIPVIWEIGFASVSADEPFNQPWEKGSVRVGGFVSAFDSSVEFGINNLGGIKIDAESVLGLDSSLLVLRADALYRPGKSRRHQIGISYSSYNRHARGTLTEEIEIGDEILLPGTEIESLFDFDIILGTYSYALVQDDRMRVSLGLGVYVVPLSYGVEVTSPGDDRDFEVSDITLPLPAVNFRGEFLLLPKLFLMSEINGMYLQVGDFKGYLVEASLGVEYRPWKHLGLGVAFDTMTVNVESKQANDYIGADFVGAVDVSFTGIMVYGKLTF